MPQWKEKVDKSGHTNPDSFSQLLPLLESPDPETANSIKDAIQDTLSSCKDSKLLNNVIDFYVATQSKNSLEILLHVREPHEKHIFEKINELVKSENTRYNALQLLGNIVYRQPSWLYKISTQRLMQTLLHMLKTDFNSPNLLSGLFILICILPLVPHQFGSLLSDTFDIFSRLAAWNIKKPTALSDVINLHLQTGVYSLFHRLYGMFPCNFLAYLRSFYGGRDCTKENFEVFSQIIKPMLERVRLHPLLVTASKETELSVNRWKKMAYHDIIVECAFISLDTIEGTYENFRSTSLSLSSQTENISSNEGAISVNFSSLSNSSVVGESGSFANDSLPSYQENIWSPSQACDVSAFSYPPSNSSLPTVTKGEWEFKNVMQSSTEESIPLDFAVEAKPELLKNDLVEAPENIHSEDTMVNKMKKSEVFSQNSTDSDVIVLNQEKCAVPFEDVDHEVSEITSTQALEQSTITDDVREDTPFCSTTQNLTDEPANLIETVIPHSGRSDSLTKSIEEGTEEMYNSMQEPHIQPYSRFRFLSHCGPAPEIVPVLKKPKAFRSISCPAEICPLSQNNSADLEIVNGENSQKSETAIVTCNMTSTCNSAFVSLPNQISSVNATAPPIYQQLLPVVTNHSLYFEQPVVIGQQNNVSPNQMPKYLSPTELLDVYIQHGSASYLNHLPLTARKDTDWTHFGGKPPPDEIDVLNNQVLLLHNMLLFERHRKDIHSERNRRLLGRIKRARMHEEFIEALRSEILSLTNENESLTRELSSQYKIYQQLLNHKKKMENEFDSRVSKIGQENTQLLFSNKQLQTLLVSQKEENDEIRELYKRVQCDIANMKCQLRYARREVQHCQKVKKEVIFLTKQLILLQELNAHYKNKLEKMKQPQLPDVGSKLLINSMQVENIELKQKLNTKSILLDSLKGKLSDLENQVSNSKSKQSEKTSSCKAMKSFHQTEIMVREERLLDLQKISTEKDAHILNLYANLDELQAKIESLDMKLSSANTNRSTSSGHQSSNQTGDDGCSSISQRTDDALS